MEEAAFARGDMHAVVGVKAFGTTIQHQTIRPAARTGEGVRRIKKSPETRLAMGMHTVAVKALRQKLDEGVTSTPLPMSIGSDLHGLLSPVLGQRAHRR